MKNLRKILAVVLVVCMAFSLMAVASAKQITDYSDASSVKYTEAVDLMTGLGIMTGTGGTTFDPTTTFTREMAAKVICYILLGDAVSASLTTSTSSFSDVAVTRWSAPYIQYCAAAGIINGVGDGKFVPEAPITGTTMAKLLLTAIGYGVKGEYTGPNWEINTLVKAQSLGILDTGVNYSAAATREQVAKYVFNVLTKASCNTASYNPVYGRYEVGTRTLGQDTFALIKITPPPASYIGVLSHYWKAGIVAPKVVSGTYNDDNVLATSHNGFFLTWLTDPANGSYKASYNPDTTADTDTDIDVTFYYNGAVSTKAVAEAKSMNPGVIVKLIDNGYDGLIDNVWVLDKMVTTVSALPTVDAAGTVSFGNISTVPFVKGTIVYPTGLALGDVISYVTVAGVTYVEKNTKVTGTMTASSTGLWNTATFAGTKYTLAVLGGVDIMSITTSANFNIAATGWVDSNGYLIKLKADVVANYNYGLLVGYSFSDDGLGTGSAIARLYTNDGKVAVYSVAANAFGVVPNQEISPTNVYNATTNPSPVFNFVQTGGDPAAVNAYLVSYVIGTDGKVTLTKATNPASNLTETYAAKGTTVEVNNNVYYITSATKVIYFNGAAWSGANTAVVLTGFNSAANITVPDTAAVTVAQNAQFPNLLDAIYFVQAPATATAGNYAYLVSASYSLRVVNGLNYYDYTGYVNGVAKTLTTGATNIFTAPGLYGYAVDAFGNVASANMSAPVVQINGGAGGKVTFVDPGFIGYTFGSTNAAVVTDANTVYYKVNAFGVATQAIAVSDTVNTTTIMYVKTVSASNTTAAEVYFTVTPTV